MAGDAVACASAREGGGGGGVCVCVVPETFPFLLVAPPPFFWRQIFPQQSKMNLGNLGTGNLGTQ